jgi:hypothetical protein
MIFQETLAESETKVLPLGKILAEGDILKKLGDHWEFIFEKINYYPIFHLAREILLCLTSSKDTIEAVKYLAEQARRIVSMRAALRHDLMGRIYHRLLADRKYLGTFYTRIPSATLLLKLALNHDLWPLKWHNLEELAEFRIADLACGTGTLLMAAADAVEHNYISQSAILKQPLDLSVVQKILTEQILHGYDVIPSAIHLTASTLALRAPEVPFRGMNLYSLPLGGSHHRLGSIEFITDGKLISHKPLFSSEDFQIEKIKEGNINSDEKIEGDKGEIREVNLPQLDLCVMNPPFTRSVGGNLLFGSAPDEERREMQKKLKKLIDGTAKYYSSITAGLGSVFVATADPRIKVDGRIALVLPKALLSGVAWEKTRELFRHKYRVEYVVASHDPHRWNFSENTSLSEVLVVAKKIYKDASPNNRDASKEEGSITAINLWHNPTTTFEALAIARALINEEASDIAKGQGALDITIGDRKVGEAVSLPWTEIKEQFLWILPNAFAQADLIRAAYHLIRNKVWLPGRKKMALVQLCSLKELGDLGPDVRDIHDGFKTSKAKTSYPAFWNHDADAVYTLAQVPNQYLTPLSKAKEGRHLRKAEDLWPKAGKILISERVRLNTQENISVRLSKKVLSNVWWPLALKGKRTNAKREKALTLWLNSTLGLLMILANREETEGAWVKFKKPVLGAMPVLDVQALKPKQLKDFAETYDKICEKTLLPFPEMADDPVRAEIDASIAKALKLPDFSILRELLAQEPIICLRPLES